MQSARPAERATVSGSATAAAERRARQRRSRRTARRAHGRGLADGIEALLGDVRSQPRPGRRCRRWSTRRSDAGASSASTRSARGCSSRPRAPTTRARCRAASARASACGTGASASPTGRSTASSCASSATSSGSPSATATRRAAACCACCRICRSAALGELVVLVLEHVGFSELVPRAAPGRARRRASPEPASCARRPARSARPSCVRRDGREIGRERVTELRGALHHYGPAHAGWLLTTGQVLSGAREEAASPGRVAGHGDRRPRPRRACARSTASASCATQVPLLLPDLDLLDGVRVVRGAVARRAESRCVASSSAAACVASALCRVRQAAAGVALSRRRGRARAACTRPTLAAAG